MSNSFDINKFNSFLDLAAENITCGEACQREKEAASLKEKYNAAQSNLINARPQFKDAQKKYYTYVAGQAAYTEMMEKERTSEAEQATETFRQTAEDEIAKIKTQLHTYTALSDNTDYVEELYETYKKENEGLERKLAQVSSTAMTNDRKTFYEDQENEVLNLYYYRVLWVMYAVIVIVFGVILFDASHVRTVTKMLLFIFFLLLPVISTWLLGVIVKIAYFVVSLLPKNVYSNFFKDSPSVGPLEYG